MRSVDPRVTAFSFRRQLLDGRTPAPVAVLEAVPGIYAAMPSGPLSIRARCRRATPDAIRELEAGRAAIRMRGMRTSAFLVARSQAALVAAATAVPPERFAWLARGAGIEDGALPGVREAVTLAAADPSTPAELRARLSPDGTSPPWVTGERFRLVLSLLTALGDLVAIGAGSLSSSAVRYVDRRTWLGDEPGGPGTGVGAIATDEARAWLAGSYLHAFGPASIEDLAWWAGWSRRDAEAGIAAHRTVDVGSGLQLRAEDLPAYEAGAPLPDEITLLPKWDAWTMGYPLEGRGRFLDRAVHDRVFDGDGNGLAMVLRGGRAIGAWAHRGAGRSMTADLDLFEPVAASERAVIEAELASIASFLGYRGVEVRDVATVIPARRRQRRPLDG